MGWVSRLFDARDTLVRMLLLDLSGVGYLVFGTGAGHAPTRTQWVLALIAFGTALLLHQRRVANLLAQSALLIVAFVMIDDQMINEVGAAFALLELTMAATRPRTFAAGAALVAAINLTAGYAHGPDRWTGPLYAALVVVGLPVLLGLVIRTTRELGQQAEAKAEAERQQRESESRAARADERSAIARELHDVVAHHVASMVLRVGVARHVLPDADPRVTDVFDDVHRTGTAALADLRRLVAVLRDPSVRTDAALTALEPSALPAALAAAVATAEQAGLTIARTLSPEASSIDAVRGMAVLRLTQEALTNVAKHAGPTARATLAVTVTDGNVHWSVTDDGGGTPPGLPAGGSGHGLTGMRERVEVLGGTLTAGPDGNGWRVATLLPGTDQPAAAAPASPPAAASLVDPGGSSG
ncbi:sensor histidine kinase [Actinoplanes sp. NPDC051859]|uniref:sensor histidine kinase n=1 Tax=Actinoplanes sp. NPDC051859 TaxID=3363909 RepID=UPI0037B433C8